MRKHVAAAVVAAFFIHAGAAAVQAEDDNFTVSEDGAIVSYAPAFFDQFNALTALDMVERIPGFGLDAGDNNVRGLSGSFGNVLVNNERPNAKVGGLESILRRIPAGEVERIDLVRGSVAEIDMRGQSRVVNVITSGGGEASYTYRGRLTHWESGRVLPSGEISASLSRGATDLTLGLELHTVGDRTDGFEIDLDAERNLLERRTEFEQRTYWEVNPTFSLEHRFGEQDSARANGRFWSWEFNPAGAAERFRPVDGGEVPAGFEFTDTENSGTGGEVSGDYEHVFNENLTGKLIGLQLLFENEVRVGFELFDEDGFENATVFENANVGGESVLRTTLTWTPGERHTLEGSLEGAYNFQDSESGFFSDDGSGLSEIPLPVADTKVEEYRAETGLSHVWRPHEEFTLESALAVEFSRIVQTGDAEKERSFTYPKPSLTGTWNISGRDQLRFTAERRVGQLNFSEFVSEVTVDDDQTNLGNPELEPDRTWRLQAAWERRFSEEASASLTIRHEWVDGVTGLVPVRALDGTLFDAPGNLGDGTRTMLLGDATLPLDRIGLPGAVLEPQFFIRRTEVTDPLTGEERDFGGEPEWRAEVNFRQDFPEREFSWGFGYAERGDDRQFRVDELVDFTRPNGAYDAFVETTRWLGVTMRLGMDGYIATSRKRTRTFFEPDRDTGSITGFQIRERDTGPRFYFEISGVI